jgi:hypothetical protein
VCQVCDVGLNKPFKDAIRSHFYRYCTISMCRELYKAVDCAMSQLFCKRRCVQNIVKRVLTITGGSAKIIPAA